MKFNRRRRSVALAAALLLATSILGACGSDDGDTASGGGDGAPPSEDGVAEAQEIIAEYMTWTPDEAADVVPGPLSETPPTDMTVYWLQCGVAVCVSIGDSVEEAGEELGWTVERIDMGNTPDSIQAAWNQALSDPPDLIMSSGVDAVQIEEQLARAEEMGIPYIGGSNSDTPGEGNIAVVSGVADKQKHGELTAAWVAAETGGDANVVYFNLSDFPILVDKEEAFRAELERLCPDCEMAVENVAATDIGKTVPGKVVSYLQANPDTDYIVYGTGSLTTGVNQALTEAGVGDIPAVTSAGTQPVWEEIESGGSLVADIPNNDAFQGWQLIDRAARHFVGDPTMGEGFHEDDGLGTPYRFATEETIEDPSAPFVGPDGFRDQWRELWLLDE